MKPTYEELQQQLVAVVAENVGLKEFVSDDCWIYDTDVERYRDAVDYVPETPATDDYLAEAKAKGAELAGDYLKQYAQSVHDEARLVLQDAGELCNGFAAKLRQGAKS